MMAYRNILAKCTKNVSATFVKENTLFSYVVIYSMVSSQLCLAWLSISALKARLRATQRYNWADP